MGVLVPPLSPGGLYKRCLPKGESTYMPFAFLTLLLCMIFWWVGHPLQGRGRRGRGKWLSFKLNLPDIAGLNTRRVFKCDCSEVLLVDLLFGFAASFSSLLIILAHVHLVYSLFMFIQRTDLLRNGASSLHTAFTSPLSAWDYPCSLLWKGERVWVMTYLFPHQHCSCTEVHMLISSEPWEIPQGHILRHSEQMQPHWFPDQRPDEWVLKSIHLLIASVSKQLIKSSRACQCLRRNTLLKERRTGRRRSPLNLWGKRICCK